MKRIGIDFGTKKIGIAITDDAGKMAFPHAVVPNDGKFLNYIESLVSQRGVKEIVIGHSIDNTGKNNNVHKLVEEFITDITLSLGIPVHLEPEHYTSKQAEQIQGKNSQIDASAAALILDSYLMKQK